MRAGGGAEPGAGLRRGALAGAPDPLRRWRASRPTRASPTSRACPTPRSSPCPRPPARRWWPSWPRSAAGARWSTARASPRPARRARNGSGRSLAAAGVDAAARPELLRAGQLRRARADLARPARRRRAGRGRAGRRRGVPVVVDRDQRDDGRQRAAAGLRRHRRQRRPARRGGRSAAALLDSRAGLGGRDDRRVARGPARLGAAGRPRPGPPDRPGRAGARAAARRRGRRSSRTPPRSRATPRRPRSSCGATGSARSTRSTRCSARCACCTAAARWPTPGSPRCRARAARRR